MECVICGRRIRRDNKTGYCHAHSREKNRRSLEIIKRKCLKCDKEFLALGRHNRICPNCHETNKGIVNAARYQTSLGNAWIGQW